MKSLSNFFAVMLILASAAIACSWNRTDSNATGNSNSVAASTPEPAGTPASSEAEAQFVSVEPLVADLYKQHDAEKGPFRERRRAVIDKYFAKPLADMIWKNEQRPEGEMGAIDADPLYDAQDTQIKKFNVGKAVIDGSKATVTVTFENFGEKKKLQYMMVREGDAWKISDIKYPGGHTLLQNFREYEKTASDPPADTSAPGEFEGKYRVGATTCVVKPVKQAFEIRWAKGSGSEYFFYKDANVFESEKDKSGGRNEFRFDDENFNTGTFTRADGKRFAVSRG
jgi:hypothetical protein